MFHAGFLRQLKPLAQFARPGRVPRGIERRDEGHQLPHAHPPKHRLVLRDVSHAPAHLQRRQRRVQTQNANLSRIRLEQSQQRADGGRLARAVAPQQRETSGPPTRSCPARAAPRLEPKDLATPRISMTGESLMGSGLSCRSRAAWRSGQRIRTPAAASSGAATPRSAARLASRSISCPSSSRCALTPPARQGVGDVSPIPLAPAPAGLRTSSRSYTRRWCSDDRQFLGQLPHAGQPISRRQRSAGTMAADLVGDLPRNRHARGCFNPEKQRSGANDYRYITLIIRFCKD